MHRTAFVVSLLFAALVAVPRARAAPSLDPLAAWLSTEGLVPGAIDRDTNRGWVNVSLTRGPHRFDGDRLALVRRFAARAAALEGLPALDTVDLEPPVHRREGPLVKTFRRLTLRLAQPSLDGPCIDPRVEVGLYDDQLESGAYAPPRATSLTVRCEKEPAEGSKPPPDAGRILPRAAAGALPFVATCVLGRGKAMVIDKRGDVYSYEPRLSPTSGRALAIEIRRGKHFEGSLAPGALDRLVALAPLVASAKYERKPGGADLESASCDLFRAGPDDELVRVRLDESGAAYGRRLGQAAEEARRLVHREEANN